MSMKKQEDGKNKGKNNLEAPVTTTELNDAELEKATGGSSGGGGGSGKIAFAGIRPPGPTGPGGTGG
jgi:hypothetical protein